MKNSFNVWVILLYMCPEIYPSTSRKFLISAWCLAGKLLLKAWISWLWLAATFKITKLWRIQKYFLPVFWMEKEETRWTSMKSERKIQLQYNSRALIIWHRLVQTLNIFSQGGKCHHKGLLKTANKTTTTTTEKPWV